MDDIDREQMRRLLGQVGSIKTEKKAASSAANGKLGGRPDKPLGEIPCSCEAGEAIDGHKSTCLRGKAIQRRRKAGRL